MYSPMRGEGPAILLLAHPPVIIAVKSVNFPFPILSTADPAMLHTPGAAHAVSLSCFFHWSTSLVPLCLLHKS